MQKSIIRILIAFMFLINMNSSTLNSESTIISTSLATKKTHLVKKQLSISWIEQTRQVLKRYRAIIITLATTTAIILIALFTKWLGTRNHIKFNNDTKHPLNNQQGNIDELQRIASNNKRKNENIEELRNDSEENKGRGIKSALLNTNDNSEDMNSQSLDDEDSVKENKARDIKELLVSTNVLGSNVNIDPQLSDHVDNKPNFLPINEVDNNRDAKRRAENPQLVNNAMAQRERYKPLYYATLLYDAANLPDFRDNIMKQVFSNSLILKKYKKTWENMHKKEKNEELLDNIEKDQNSFTLDISRTYLDRGVDFPEEGKEEDRVSSLIIQEYSDAMSSISEDAKRARGKNVEFDIYYKSLSKVEQNKKRAIVLYTISKNIYYFMEDYLEKLYQQMIEVVCKQGNFEKRSIEKEDIRKATCAVLEKEWQKIVKDMQDNIPTTLEAVYLRPEPIFFGKNNKYTVNLGKKTKKALQAFTYKAIEIFAPCMLRIVPKATINEETLEFQPKQDIKYDKRKYEILKLKLTPEQKRIKKTKKLNENQYYTLAYYQIITLTKVLPDGSRQPYTPSYAAFAFDKKLEQNES